MGDLFDPVPPSFEGVTDVVVGVVPYVPTDALGQLARDTLEFETPLAYDGGSGGTVVLRRVLAGARRFLRSGGALLVELGGGQAGALGTTSSASAMSTWRCSPTGRRRPRRRGDLRRGAHQALGPRFCLPLAAPACEQAAVAPVPLVVVGTQHGPRPVWGEEPVGQQGIGLEVAQHGGGEHEARGKVLGPPSARAASSRRRVSARAAHHGRSHRRAARAAPSPAGTKEPASRSAPGVPSSASSRLAGRNQHPSRSSARRARAKRRRRALRASAELLGAAHEDQVPRPVPRCGLGGPARPLAPLALEEVPGKPVTPGAVGHRLPGSRHAGKGDAHRVLGDAEEPCRVHQLGDRELGGSMPSSVLASTERAVRGALRSCGALRCCIR